MKIMATNNLDSIEYDAMLIRIVESGKGYDAITKLSVMLDKRDQILRACKAETDNTLKAVGKIVYSDQTAGQKIKGIKALTEEQENE